MASNLECLNGTARFRLPVHSRPLPFDAAEDGDGAGEVESSTGGVNAIAVFPLRLLGRELS